MPKTIYVPTGEIRNPHEGEFFAPPTLPCSQGECECHKRAVDGVLIELCFVAVYPEDKEIYEAVTING